MDCGRFRDVDSKGGEGSVDHTGLTAEKRECATTHSRWIREYGGFGLIGSREGVLMECAGRGDGRRRWEQKRAQRLGWGEWLRRWLSATGKGLSETGDGLACGGGGTGGQLPLELSTTMEGGVKAVAMLRVPECR
ncbi:hypothetical protein RJZ56_001520 [Blastomyces dermatitidis]